MINSPWHGTISAVLYLSQFSLARHDKDPRRLFELRVRAFSPDYLLKNISFSDGLHCHFMPWLHKASPSVFRVFQTLLYRFVKTRFWSWTKYLKKSIWRNQLHLNGSIRILLLFRWPGMCLGMIAASLLFESDQFARFDQRIGMTAAACGL